MDRRLTLIKVMVQPCGTAADIGTDHGFLVCALVAAGTAEHGIAADINPMPLDKARQEIAGQGLSKQISAVLTDGLDGITLSDGDAVIIAGMGGELIARILEDGGQHGTVKLDYYLQPMTKPERLRSYLYKTGYCIVEERCCVAASRPYSAIHARYTGVVQMPTPVQLYLGGIDPQATAAEAAYCLKLRNRLAKRIGGIASSGDSNTEMCMLIEVVDELTRRTKNASF